LIDDFYGKKRMCDPKMATASLREQPGSADFIAAIEARVAESSRRYFSVRFRNGVVRVVYPNDEDPLRYNQQVLADGEGLKLLPDETTRAS
jgi:hypothetical protein